MLGAPDNEDEDDEEVDDDVRTLEEKEIGIAEQALRLTEEGYDLKVGIPAV